MALRSNPFDAEQICPRASLDAIELPVNFKIHRQYQVRSGQIMSSTNSCRIG